jgi:hypothetical protein
MISILALASGLLLQGTLHQTPSQRTRCISDLSMISKTYCFFVADILYEDGINPFEDDYADRTSVFTGPTGGVSLRVPLNKENGSVSLLIILTVTRILSWVYIPLEHG